MAAAAPHPDLILLLLLVLLLATLGRLLLALTLALAAVLLPLLQLLGLRAADVASEELALVQTHTLVLAQSFPESMNMFAADVSGRARGSHSFLGRKLVATVLGRHDAVGFPQLVNVPLFAALLLRLGGRGHDELRGSGNAHHWRLGDHPTPLLVLLAAVVLLAAIVLLTAATALRRLFLVLLVDVAHIYVCLFWLIAN